MEIKITGQHIEVSPALKEHINQKATKIIRHFEKVMWIHVILKVEKNEHIAEAKMHASGHDFFAESKAGDMYASIDAMMSKLDAQVMKHKNKQQKRQ